MPHAAEEQPSEPKKRGRPRKTREPEHVIAEKVFKSAPSPEEALADAAEEMPEASPDDVHEVVAKSEAKPAESDDLKKADWPKEYAKAERAKKLAETRKKVKTEAARKRTEEEMRVYRDKIAKANGVVDITDTMLNDAGIKREEPGELEPKPPMVIPKDFAEDTGDLSDDTQKMTGESTMDNLRSLPAKETKKAAPKRRTAREAALASLPELGPETQSNEATRPSAPPEPTTDVRAMSEPTEEEAAKAPQDLRGRQLSRDEIRIIKEDNVLIPDRKAAVESEIHGLEVKLNEMRQSADDMTEQMNQLGDRLEASGVRRDSIEHPTFLASIAVGIKMLTNREVRDARNSFLELKNRIDNSEDAQKLLAEELDNKKLFLTNPAAYLESKALVPSAEEQAAAKHASRRKYGRQT